MAADRSALADAHAALDAANAAEATGDLAALSQANRRFHRALYSACGNPLAVSILDGIQDQVALGAVAVLWPRWPDRPAEHAQQHRAILEAVEAGESDRAEALVTEHLESSAARYRELEHDAVELRHLRYFLALAAEQHFERAASQVGISQSALSQQIRKFEDEIGFVLFARSTQGVTVTPAGDAMIPDARAALDRAERAVASARRVARGQTGWLGIAFAGPIVDRIIPPPSCAPCRRSTQTSSSHCSKRHWLTPPAPSTTTAPTFSSPAFPSLTAHC